jgi:hypothetical protein
MRTHTIDYRERKGEGGGLLNRGITIYELPRPVIRCRLFGHKPVVDGTGTIGEPGYLSRWVACDRCGERPEPQGKLGPARWNLGETYTGNFNGGLTLETGHNPEISPGSWPTSTFEFHSQIVIGGGYPGFGAQLKIGNAGSENALGGHLHLGRIFGFYWSTGDLGRGIQRRLNPTGYESKVLDLSANHGRLSWRVWADRDGGYHRDTPRWRDGSARYRPLDILFGPKRFELADVGEPITAELVMPHGDRHDVALQLRRRTVGRKRTRTRFDGWNVDWKVRPGIPTKPHGRGTIHGSGVRLDAVNPESSAWAFHALDQIRDDISEIRTRYDYVPAQEGTGQ